MLLKVLFSLRNKQLLIRLSGLFLAGLLNVNLINIASYIYFIISHLAILGISAFNSLKTFLLIPRNPALSSFKSCVYKRRGK
jgi:hypothetical protein